MLPKTRILLIRSLSMGIHLCNAVPDLYPQIRGGGGGYGQSPKNSVWSKNKEGAGPSPGSATVLVQQIVLHVCTWLNLHARDLVKFCHTLQTGLAHGNEAHEGEPMEGNLK